MNKEKIVEIINNSLILKRLTEGRVCGFYEPRYSEEASVEDAFNSKTNELILRECCDGYFCEGLDKNDVIELSKVFSEIAKHM